ncbi:MAG: hypothetical protein U0234_07740 [Sandaracinus sp.]
MRRARPWLVALALAGCTQVDVVARELGDAAGVDAAVPPLFVEDFETCDYRRWAGADPGATRIDDGIAHAGLCSSVSGEMPTLVSDRHVDFTPEDGLWVRAWFRFGPSFVASQPSSNITLLRVGDGTDALQVSIYVPVGGNRLSLDTTPPPGLMQVEVGSTYVVDAAGERGAWHCAELHVQLEPVGASGGGTLELFVDGSAVLSTTRALRGANDLRLSRLRLQPAIFGGASWPADNRLNLDDLVVDVRRPGCAP